MVAVAIHPASPGTLTNEVTKMIECSLVKSRKNYYVVPTFKSALTVFQKKGIIGYVYTTVVIETIIQPFWRPGKSFRIMSRLAFIPPVPNSLTTCWGASAPGVVPRSML